MSVKQQLSDTSGRVDLQYGDLENLLSATDVAAICLDSELRILWCTSAAAELLGLNVGYCGQQISDAAILPGLDEFVAVCQDVLRTRATAEADFLPILGRLRCRCITPLRSHGEPTDTIIATFVEIDAQDQPHAARGISQAWRRKIIDSLRESILVLDDEFRVLLANRTFYRTFQLGRQDTTGQLVFDLVNGQWDIPELRRLLRDMLPNQDFCADFMVEHTFTSIGYRAMMFNARRLKEPNWIVLAIEDVTDQTRCNLELRQLNESLEQQVSERMDLLEILRNIAIASNEAVNVEEALTKTFDYICRYNHWLTGHAYHVIENDSTPIVSMGIGYINNDLAAEPDKQATLQRFQHWACQTNYGRGEGHVGIVVETGQPYWVANAGVSDSWPPDQAGGLKAAVAFPVLIKDKVVAVLACYSDRELRREDRFMEIMQNVGIQLGHVFERKRLEKELAESVEREQRRIGSDIHDDLGQELTGLRLIAQTHAEELAAQSSPQEPIARRLCQGLETVQKSLREVVRHLLPVELDRESFFSALRMLSKQKTDIHKINCHFECDGEITIKDQTTATHLYRIAQEAVNNAAKHSCGREITIRLTEERRFIRLQILDDGIGLADQTKHGIGLRTMAHRAALLDGRLIVETIPGGRGTSVTCLVPRSTIDVTVDNQ